MSAKVPHTDGCLSLFCPQLSCGGEGDVQSWMSGGSRPRAPCCIGALRLQGNLLYKLLHCHGWHSGSSGFQPRVKLQSCHWKARPYLRTFRELSDIAARIEQNMLVPLTQIWRSGKTLSSLIFIIYFSVISWIIQPGDDVGFELFGGLRPFLHSRGWQTLAHGPRLAHQPCLFRWSAKCSSTFLRSVGDEDEETALLWCGRPER